MSILPAAALLQPAHSKFFGRLGVDGATTLYVAWAPGSPMWILLVAYDMVARWAATMPARIVALRVPSSRF